MPKTKSPKKSLSPKTKTSSDVTSRYILVLELTDAAKALFKFMKYDYYERIKKLESKEEELRKAGLKSTYNALSKVIDDVDKRFETCRNNGIWEY